MTLLQYDFLSSSSSPSLCPPLPLSPGFLDAEQTQCSLCKITRLINANKQTTALRQLQMKANLYTINKRRSSFNLPVCPACCSTPPFLPPSSASPPPPTYSSHPPVCSLSQSLLCCWAGLKGKENWLTHRLFIDHPFFLSLSVLFFFWLSLQCSVYLQALCQSLQGGELGDGKICCSGLSFGVIGRPGSGKERGGKQDWR